MNSSYWLLGGVVMLAGAMADGFAHHDELAARRFRELDPRIVGSALDRSRNRRWHRAGFRLRLAVVTGLAVATAFATKNWLVGGLTMLVAGALVSLLFDILFNIRFGLPWDYAGSTAWLDEWLNKFGVKHQLNAGRWSAGLELTGALVGIVAWLLIF